MASLAAAVDVAHELGLADESALSSEQAAKIPGRLTKASTLFRLHAGRQFTASTYTHRCMVVGGRCHPLETPITSVQSVVDDSGNNVAFTRVGNALNVSGHHGDNESSFACYQPQGVNSGWFVTVTYEGGGVPDDVRVTVAEIVARTFNANPEAAGGVKSHEQTLGPITERKQFFDWAGMDAVTLTEDDIALAESYRDPRGARIVHQS